MKKVSLILTTFNSIQYLPLTLESIHMQDYPNMEIIIKDGGSTDGTLRVIEKAAAGQKNIIWKSCPDTGIYDAMNQGYEMSTGDLLVFFNDLFKTPKAVTMLVEAIGHTDRNVIGAHADLVYKAADGSVVRYWKTGQGKISRGWMPAHPTLLLKREIYERYGLYRTELRCSADYEFMVRVLKDPLNRLGYVPEVLVEMFYGGTSNSSLKAYLISLKEGHMALRLNHIEFALWIDFRRTLRVLKQFIAREK